MKWVNRIILSTIFNNLSVPKCFFFIISSVLLFVNFFTRGVRVRSRILARAYKGTRTKSGSV